MSAWGLASYLPDRLIWSRECQNGRSRAVKCFFFGRGGLWRSPSHLHTGFFFVLFGGDYPAAVSLQNMLIFPNFFSVPAGLTEGCRRRGLSDVDSSGGSAAAAPLSDGHTPIGGATEPNFPG